jgi:hypothetical protein
VTRRAWLVAGILAVVVAVVVVVGFLVTRTDENGTSNGSPSPTTTGAIEAQVEQAYLSYWEARTEALIKLDPAPLEQATTGAALEASRKLVEEQRQSGQPVRVRVEHNYRVVIRSQDEAVVDDTLISHSVRLDPKTNEPVEPDPNLTIRNTYTLRKVDGQWKVAEIIGIESSP